MAFSIEEIYGAVNQRGGIARSAHFSVLIPSIPPMQVSDHQALTVLAKTASLPGIAHQPVEIYPFGYGMPEKRPVQAQVSNITIVFLADVNQVVENALYNWYTYIYPFGNDPQQTRFQYPERYVNDLVVTRYAPDGRAIAEYVLEGGYPASLPHTQLDWENKDHHLVIPVDFAFRTWQYRKL